MSIAYCVNPEWDSVLVLHRKDSKAEWELPAAKIAENEKPEAAAARAAKEQLGIDVEILSKLGELDDIVWFQGKIKSGIPKAQKPYDRVRYMEFFILRRKPEKLSAPLAALIEEMRFGRIVIQKTASVSWKK